MPAKLQDCAAHRGVLYATALVFQLLLAAEITAQGRLNLGKDVGGPAPESLRVEYLPKTGTGMGAIQRVRISWRFPSDATSVIVAWRSEGGNRGPAVSVQRQADDRGQLDMVMPCMPSPPFDLPSGRYYVDATAVYPDRPGRTAHVQICPRRP